MTLIDDLDLILGSPLRLHADGYALLHLRHSGDAGENFMPKHTTRT